MKQINTDLFKTLLNKVPINEYAPEQIWESKRTIGSVCYCDNGWTATSGNDMDFHFNEYQDLLEANQTIPCQKLKLKDFIDIDFLKENNIENDCLYVNRTSNETQSTEGLEEAIISLLLSTVWGLECISQTIY